MKKHLLLALFAVISLTTFAQRKENANSPLNGSWKYSRQSVKNDFQFVGNSKTAVQHATEELIFEGKNQFRHEFLDKDGFVVKVLKGKYSIQNDKVKIVYADIKYELTVDYFFIGDELVLGNNFQHIILSKQDLNAGNVALK